MSRRAPDRGHDAVIATSAELLGAGFTDPVVLTIARRTVKTDYGALTERLPRVGRDGVERVASADRLSGPRDAGPRQRSVSPQVRCPPRAAPASARAAPGRCARLGKPALGRHEVAAAGEHFPLQPRVL
jgi:hypothetical protein